MAFIWWLVMIALLVNGALGLAVVWFVIGLVISQEQ